jgi:hypothetical protein
MENLKQINELLGDLRNLGNNKKLKFVQRTDINTPIADSSYVDGIQGEEDLYAEIFKVVDKENVFLRVEYYTDSYGENETIGSISFVEAKEKLVQQFEKI